MSLDEEAAFKELLGTDLEERKQKLEEVSKRLKSADEYETLGLYGKES